MFLYNLFLFSEKLNILDFWHTLKILIFLYFSKIIRKCQTYLILACLNIFFIRMVRSTLLQDRVIGCPPGENWPSRRNVACLAQIIGFSIVIVEIWEFSSESFLMYIWTLFLCIQIEISRGLCWGTFGVSIMKMICFLIFRKMLKNIWDIQFWYAKTDFLHIN